MAGTVDSSRAQARAQLLHQPVALSSSRLLSVMTKKVDNMIIIAFLVIDSDRRNLNIFISISISIVVMTSGTFAAGTRLGVTAPLMTRICRLLQVASVHHRIRVPPRVAVTVPSFPTTKVVEGESASSKLSSLCITTEVVMCTTLSGCCCAADDAAESPPPFPVPPLTLPNDDYISPCHARPGHTNDQ